MKKVIIISKVAAVALAGSIDKWETCAHGGYVAQGTDDCPLCVKFWDSTNVYGGCQLCPIQKDTGHPYCRGTPYKEYTTATGDAPADDLVAAAEAIPEAKAELKYLKELQRRCFVRVKGDTVKAASFSADGSCRSKPRS